MEVDTMIKMFEEVAQELDREFANFKKDSSTRKTPAYKEKKLAKATALYEKANDLVNKIKTSSDPNQCFELEIKNFSANYKQYVSELKAIPEGNSRADRDEPSPSAILIQQQGVRFEVIRRIIEDVKTTMQGDQAPVKAYCRMKLKMIQDGWARIQCADEGFEEDRATLPKNYSVKMVEYEQDVELICLYLETELDNMGGSQSQRKEDIKLPRVTIPKFHGDYFKWTSFRDLFSTMVKDKDNLSDGQKMQMLKTLVEGEAGTIIADLTIADVNFESAWDRLMDRYDNNRVVVYKHMHKLITQQPAKNDARSLKRILDTTDQILLALKNLGRPTQHWDDWIIITVTQRLNEESRKDWERKIGDSTELPTWDQLKKFLGEQFRMMEGIENSNRKDHSRSLDKPEKPEKAIIRTYQSTVATTECAACGENHKLFACLTFKKMEVKHRWDLAKKKKLCFACLQTHEDKLSCEKIKPCKKCAKRHSTWLHEEKSGQKTTTIVSAHGQIKLLAEIHPTGLLATLLVLVENNLGQCFYLRALLDSGSQASLITNKAAALVNQPTFHTSVQINGIGGTQNGRSRMIFLSMKPRFHSNFAVNIGCYLLKKLTEPLPNKDIDISKWDHLKNLTLADPLFNLRGDIDLLLGADIIADIMLPQIIKGPTGTPMAQETEMGWIVSGQYHAENDQSKSCLVSTIEDDNDKFDLAHFWEIEELNPKRKLTVEEENCEEYYDKTVSQTEEGTYIVKIPFKKDELGPSRLGNSKNQCIARFMYLERKLAKDDNLRKEYCQVMNEYIELGHMEEVDSQTEKLYYIPHHAVIKPESLTTKTRVVFDASAKTTTGVSLNECMHTGAKQQEDLINILIQWRKFPIVYKADISKMYRMIQLDKEDQRYHTIVWRNDTKEPLKEYQLKTVTFGTAAAPFLATRTLKHIAKKCQESLPLASEAIKKGFYVDDLMYGYETPEEARASKDELIKAMNNSKMMLRKWSSNNEKFLRTIPDDMCEKTLQAFEEDAKTKALGLHWNPSTDKFGFVINFEWNEQPLTKRRMLSQASKLFDPLGWCAPVILNAKLLMQEVWNSQIDWDTLVSSSTQERWFQLREEFAELSNLEITRWIGVNKNDEIQMHGFSDASEKAYSAVVYTRTMKNGKAIIRIIASKTRVASIKAKMTLPQMELCGAVLLAHLMTTIKDALSINNLEMVAWSDSTATLGWLKGEPMKWKTFVANRTAEVQSTKVKDWRYCPTDSNPADCASRGMMPKELMKNKLWWKGPDWLAKPENHWPQLKIEETSLEQRKIVSHAATIERQDLLLGASSWFRTVRALAYCLRMKHREAIGSPLTTDELRNIEKILIKKCQLEEFPDEVRRLKKKTEISSKSRLLTLNPFLDENGIMRVGGRLQNAMITFNNKHPIILPRTHEVTQLMLEQMHKDTLHGGPQLMLTLLRKKYWIIHGKRAVTDQYKKCLACKRFRANTVQQVMGNLPEPRVTLERAFMHTGVDYCGPIEVRSSKLRGARIQKGYIAVFVCLGTRASHLELVSDCTTAAFLAAFERFIARRGVCHTMYSDNGTNFVGAYNHLAKQEVEWMHSINMEIANSVSNKGINWQFNPPGAPNFGGIWERNVRAVKDHLKRTLKTTRLTFEEYGTVLCMIEACLNSRPLQALTADTENVNALTPGHFLIGDALMALPQPSLLDTNANRLNRWKHIQLIQQHFWNRWSKEYMNQLQQRYKWKQGTKPVNIGDLVLVKDEQLPPKNWLLGRIQETHPGTDGRVRVVTLRTHKGQIKRPVNKICPLMTNEELERDNNESSSDQGEEKEHEVEEHDLGPDVKPIDDDKPIETVKLVKPVQSTIPELNTRYNLRPRHTIMTMVILFMGILLIGGGSGSETTNLVQITKFQNDAGIFFEKLGQAQTVRTQWNIYIHFDLQRYRLDLKRLKTITQELATVCLEMESQSSRETCEDTIGLIHYQLQRIDDLNALLEYNGDEAALHQRKRRTAAAHGNNWSPNTLMGLMATDQIEDIKNHVRDMNGTTLHRYLRAAPANGIGWIQHELFGVMAADQAEEINQHFQEVRRNSLHTLKLLKNQTSIIDNTIKLMKTTQRENNQNYAKIEAQIMVLKNETNLLKRRSRITELSMYTLAFVNRVEKIQEVILDMVTDLHQGYVSSQVLSPKQFKEQIEIMKNNLPPDSVVPEIAQRDIKSLYKLIKGSARVEYNYIVLQVNFPLVTSTNFHIWRIIPVPIIQRTNQLVIIPETEYIMIDLQREKFYNLNQQELRTCLRPRENMFICHMKHPLYSTTSSVSACERRLLNKQLELDSNCKIEVRPKKEFWISLDNQNQWIYGTTEQKILNVVCGSDTQQLNLDGSGTLTLAPGCEINQPGMTIIAESVKQSTENFNFYPMLNLSEAVIKAVEEDKLNGIKLINLTIDHSEQLDTLSNQLHEIDQQTELHYDFHIWQASGHIGITVLALLIVAILIWRNRTKLSKVWTKRQAKRNDKNTIDKTDDVEMTNTAPINDSSNIHHSSDDRKTDGTSTTGHKAGRCPFQI